MALRVQLFWLFLVGSAIQPAFGQAIDSLRTVLHTAQEDTTRLNCLYQLTLHFEKIDLDSTLHYGALGISLANKLENQEFSSSLLAVTGFAHFYQDRLEQAMDHFTQAERIASKYGFYQAQQSAISGMSYFYYLAGDYEKSIEKDLYNAQLAADNQDYSDQHINLFNAALTMLDIEQTEEAKQIILQLEQMEKEHEMEPSSIIIKSSYFSAKNELDSAIFYREKASALDLFVSPFEKVNNQFVIGNTYAQMGNLDESKRLLEPLLPEALDQNFMGLAREIQYNLAHVYFESKQYTEALRMLQSLQENTEESTASTLGSMISSFEVVQANYRDKEIALQTAQEKTKKRNQIIFLGVILLGTAVAFMVLYFTLSVHKKAQLRLNDKGKVLVAQLRKIQSSVSYAKRIQNLPRSGKYA